MLNFDKVPNKTECWGIFDLEGNQLKTSKGKSIWKRQSDAKRAAFCHLEKQIIGSGSLKWFSNNWNLQDSEIIPVGEKYMEHHKLTFMIFNNSKFGERTNEFYIFFINYCNCHTEDKLYIKEKKVDVVNMDSKTLINDLINKHLEIKKIN